MAHAKRPPAFWVIAAFLALFTLLLTGAAAGISIYWVVTAGAIMQYFRGLPGFASSSTNRRPGSGLAPALCSDTSSTSLFPLVPIHPRT